METMCVPRSTRIHQRIQMSQMNPISSLRMKLHDPLSGLFAQTPATVRVEKQGDDCVRDIGSRARMRTPVSSSTNLQVHPTSVATEAIPDAIASSNTWDG